ncbi:MAG: penicillin-binding protein activator, partial [Gammaproteobacteria bacterium]
IRSLIAAGDSEAAQRYADAVDAAGLTPEQRDRLDLYYAQIELSFGEAEQSLNRLARIQARGFSREEMIDYHRARAFAYSLNGQLIDSAAARLDLRPLLDPSQQQENNAAIVETLNLLPLAELERQPVRPEGLLSGWIALVRALKLDRQQPISDPVYLREWQQAYPTHPANSEFLDAYRAPPGISVNTPAAIAVFLPESGTYARVAKAVRAGITAAYERDLSTAKPVLRFYDSESMPMPALYAHAVGDGAEMIIGPLSKPNITYLAETTDLAIPVLALNHVPETTKANLLQFGLSPLDDAEQITRKAWLDGHKNALILIPNTEQGTRYGQYLQEFWQRDGGKVLGIQSYEPGQADFSTTIKQLFYLNNSEVRYRQLRKLIPSLEFVPRRRQDVDVVFLNAYETAARSIIPQLKFYHAGHIPVYATSQVYAGLPDPRQDFDLNKVIFCDAPWLFDAVYQGELSLPALRDVWHPFPGIYLRLLAMGIDAYNVVAHLNEMHTAVYRGATGHLILTESNRIKRNLVCAQFSEGIPHVMGFIDTQTEQGAADVEEPRRRSAQSYESDADDAVSE